jgi:hypothetical protein
MPVTTDAHALELGLDLSASTSSRTAITREKSSCARSERLHRKWGLGRMAVGEEFR